MPKRLANCRGFGNARFGRVRLGWRKIRMMSQLEKISKAEAEGGLEEALQQKYDAYKQKAQKFLGTKLFHRHQAR